MVKTRILAALVALVCWPALAAVETTTVSGTVYDPSATGATGGKIVCTLSAAGAASNGSTMQKVAGKYQATIQSDGTVSFTLVPNDVISPSGTYYTCEFTVNTQPRATWTETWNIASSPDPIAIGSISRSDTPNTLVAGSCINTDADAHCEVNSDAISRVILDPDDDGTANYTFIASTPVANYCLAQNAGNTGLTYVSCGAVAGSSGQAQYNSSGTMAGAPGMVFSGSGLIATTKFRHADSDTDGDGTIDSMIVGDYDGDTQLTLSDLTQAVNFLCTGDATGATPQRTKTNTTSSDVDGDGTVDATVRVCGTLTVLPGVYNGGATTNTGWQIQWDDVHIRGYGARLVSNLAAGKLFSATGGYAPYNASGFPVVSIGRSDNTPIRNVTWEGFEVVGRGSRGNVMYTNGGNEGDSDNDGTTDNQSHNISVSSPDGVVLQNFITRDADRQGLYVDLGASWTSKQRGLVVMGGEWRGEFGEHCTESDAPNVRFVGNKFSGCDGLIHTGANAGKQANTTAVINAIELWGGQSANGTLFQDIVVSGNVFDGVNNGVDYFASTGASGTYTNLSVTGNVFRNMLGQSVTVDSSQNAADTFRSIAITGNTITNNTTYPSNLSSSYQRRMILVKASPGATKQVAITGNTVSILRNNSATQAQDDAAIQVQANNATVSGNTIYLEADKRDAAGYADTGISVVSSTNVNVGNNSITCDNSQLYTTYPSCRGIAFNAVTGGALTGNSFTQSNQAATDGYGKMLGIHLLGGSGLSVTGNQARFSSAGGYNVYNDGNTDCSEVGNFQYGGYRTIEYVNAPARIHEVGNMLYNTSTVTQVSDCDNTQSCTEQGNVCVNCSTNSTNRTARGWWMRADDDNNGAIDTNPLLQIGSGTKLVLLNGTNPLTFEGVTDDGTNQVAVTTPAADYTAARSQTVDDVTGNIAMTQMIRRDYTTDATGECNFASGGGGSARGTGTVTTSLGYWYLNTGTTANGDDAAVGIMCKPTPVTQGSKILDPGDMQTYKTRLFGATGTSFRLIAGMVSTTSDKVMGANMGGITEGVFFKCDPSANTHWFGETCTGGSCTHVDLTTACNTASWFTLQYTRVSASSVKFYINGSLAGSSAAFIGADGTAEDNYAGVWAENTDTTNEDLYVDYQQLTARQR